MLKSSLILISARKYLPKLFLWTIGKRSGNIHVIRRYLSSRIASSPAVQDDSISLNNPAIKKYLTKLSDELSTLDGNARQSSEIAHTVVLWQERQRLSDDLTALAQLRSDSTDKELTALAEEEKQELNKKIAAVDEQILQLLVPEDNLEVDPDTAVLEVSAGVGGQEAMLFAAELLDMYQGYVAHRGWEQDRAELELSELGGLRHGSISVNGVGAFLELRHEGGVHRVQRVPRTEKAGRVHTSTVSVAVLPQPSEVTVVLNPKDLKIETKRSSGAGGQHVNTTDSCVSLTHIPSGLVVECQTERSQVQNREKAMQRLRARLYQRQLELQQSERRDNRKQQVGSSMRSDKIRTYNYPQDRVSDHRVGATLHNLRGFLSGGEALQGLLEQLDSLDKTERLRAFVNSLKK